MVVGRPVDVLAMFASAPEAALTVLGCPSRRTVSGSRRDGGTAFAVARRVSKPILLVPPTCTEWKGPDHALVPLDGTGDTALAAARGLDLLRRPDTLITTLRVAHDTEPQPINCVAGERIEIATGRVSTATLDTAAKLGIDLVVLVWARRTSGGHAVAVTEIVAGTVVPVLLVPAALH